MPPTFDYDAEGMPDPDERPFAPEGEYLLTVKAIKETVSKKKLTEEGEKGGFPQVIVTPVIAVGPLNAPNPTLKGLEMPWHYVTFFPKGERAAGMALKFLKSIGEPYQGAFKVNAPAWPGKSFRAYLIVENWEGKRRNKIKWVDGLREEDLKLLATEDLEEGVPF